MKRFTAFIILICLFLAITSCGVRNQQAEIVDEKSVVGELLNESQTFADFYNSERVNMPSHIDWIIGGTFESSGVKAYTELDSNSIHLRQLPPFANDEFIIAHELCTFILQAQGFPRLKPIAGTTNIRDAKLISAALTTMLWTPLRDSILGRYGYNLEEQYHFYVNPFFDERNRLQPTDEADKFERLYFYVQMIIYWEDTLNKKELSDFQQIFEQDYPDLAARGNYTIKRIRIFGYDSPEKMRVFYEDIIEGSKLDSILQLN